MVEDIIAVLQAGHLIALILVFTVVPVAFYYLTVFYMLGETVVGIIATVPLLLITAAVTLIIIFDLPLVWIAVLSAFVFLGAVVIFLYSVLSVDRER
jgi:hypothetical protein